MATLQDIVAQLAENKTATEQTTANVATVADLIRQQIGITRTAAENSARARIENQRESTPQRINSQAGGILSGLGDLTGGLGKGIGSAGLGIAALMAGGGYFLTALQGLDGKKIKENVLELFSISKAFDGGMLEFFTEGGTFGLAMAGIGAGLAVFGAGSAIVGLSDALNSYFGVADWASTIKSNVAILLSIADGLVGGNVGLLVQGGLFGTAMAGIGIGLGTFAVGQAAVGLAQFVTKDDWATRVKNNVATLLSIADGFGANIKLLFNGAVFPLAMTGLGIGLGTFGIGQAAVGLAQFITKDDWATRVKTNVATLLSISELPGIGWNTASFVGVMGGIASGLAAFGAGQALVGIAQFITKDDWAERVKNSVSTLVSISEVPGIGWDTAGFITVMGGIALGLAAFALGKGLNTTVEGMDRVLSYFTGTEPFAERIKTEVTTLLSIPSLVAEGSTENFVSTMSAISRGLTNFALGGFVGTLANAGAAIVSFFTGAESPFDQIRQIAGDADNLTKAASALDRIAGALSKFGQIQFDASNLDFKGMAEQLGYAIPTLKALATGGLVEGSDGWFSGGVTFPEGGILNPALRLDEMAAAIDKVNFVLGRTSINPNSVTGPATTGAEISESSANRPSGQPITIVQDNSAKASTQNNSGAMVKLDTSMPSSNLAWALRNGRLPQL